MKKGIVLAVAMAGSLILLFGLVEATFALEIIYPADKTAIFRSDFLVVRAGTSPTIDALAIQINGIASDPIEISAPEYKQAFGDFLILEPEWDLGKNRIVVKALTNGKESAVASADIFYQPDYSSVIPAGYTPYVMHLSDREQKCAPCHDMGLSKGRPLAGNESPCASCHKRMVSKKFVHGPIGVFECETCHPAKDKKLPPGTSRFSPRNNGAELCGECHDDKVAEFKKNVFVHGPVAVGMCESCHEPHGTDIEKLLRLPINALCYSCHVDIKGTPHAINGVSTSNKRIGHPVGDKKDPRRPGRELTCVSCHDPHGGAGRAFLIGGAKTAFGVCAQCHPK